MGPWTPPSTDRKTPDARPRSGYASSMTLALVLLALTAIPLKAAEPGSAPDWTPETGRPAFQAAQAVVDGVFGVASGVLKPLLPDGLDSRRLTDSPAGDTYADFTARLERGEARADRLAQESRPLADATPVDFQNWGRSAFNAHRDAAMDAFAGSLADRYGLPGFGRAANDYALDPRGWGADALAPGLLFGGAYAFLAGVRTRIPAGPVVIGLNVAPGRTLLSAAEGDSARRLARVSAALSGSPLELYAEWSARSSERVGTSWTCRF